MLALLWAPLWVHAAHFPPAAPTNADPAAQLQLAINNAVASGDHRLFVPAQEFDFGNRTLLVEGARGLTLESNGSTLWFWGWKGGVLFKECEDVTFKGFILDRNPTPYLRGNVTKVSGDTYDFEVPADSLTSLPSYWDVGQDSEAGALLWAFSGDFQQQKAKCGGAFDSGKMVPLGGRKYRYPSNGCRLEVGDNFVATVWLGEFFAPLSVPVLHGAAGLLLSRGKPPLPRTHTTMTTYAHTPSFNFYRTHTFYTHTHTHTHTHTPHTHQAT